MKIAYARSSRIFDESRASKEIVALLESGYELEIFGWDRNGEAELNCNKIFASYGQKIKYHFYTGKIGDSIVAKFLNRIKWAYWLYKKLCDNSNIDVYHSCDYDTGAIIDYICKKSNAPFVYDIYDYYVDAHPVPMIIKGFVENKEHQIINDAKCCIICSEERREQIKGTTPKKLLIIHNSPDVEECIENDEIYDYAYCGGLFEGRLIAEILEEYSENSHYSFVFAGAGQYEDKINELKHNYSKFTYFGSIPYVTVIEIESKAKVISAIYNPTIRNHKLCAPNKFYEALALGKPLIVCRGTGIDKIVEQNKIGAVIDYDAKQFYKALEELIDNPLERRKMGERARDLYEKKYRWAIMKNKLINEYSLISNELTESCIKG